MTGHRPCPRFCLKLAGRRRPQTVDPRGRLLLVELPHPHLLSPWDSCRDYCDYQEDQFRFVESLPSEIRSQLTVRLHRGFRLHRWSDEQRWRGRSPETVLDTGSSDIKECISHSRLVVHSYDGTGLLECLALNVPTLCFWDPAADLVLPSAKPYYDALRSAGILHDSPEAAATAVARSWTDITNWWDGRQVQEARRQFANQFARTESHPVRALHRLFGERRTPNNAEVHLERVPFP